MWLHGRARPRAELARGVPPRPAPLRAVPAAARRHRSTSALVDEAIVAGYVDDLSRPAPTTGTRRSASSIARALVAVRSFHRFCVEEGLLDADPSEQVGAPRVPQGIPKALDEPEIDAILAPSSGDDPRAQRDRAILEVLYATGVRISELVGLDLGDVDLDDGLAARDRQGRQGARRADGPRRARELRATTAPTAGLALRRARGADATPTRCSSTRVVGASPARALAASCARAGERVGLGDRLSPHVLRHSCATHMLDHGADIRVVQELLGHASVSTTQVYTKVSPERLRAVYDAAHPAPRTAR